MKHIINIGSLATAIVLAFQTSPENVSFLFVAFCFTAGLFAASTLYEIINDITD